MLKSILIVGFGGFIGTVARFLISRYFQFNSTSVFPWSTFIINIAGCLLIGLIYGISEKSDLLSPEIRLFMTVGICGVGLQPSPPFQTMLFCSFANRNGYGLRFTLHSVFSLD